MYRLKNIIKEWITTVLGLIVIAYAVVDIHRVSIGLNEFNWMFTSGLSVGGLLLLLSTDRFIKTTLKNVVDKYTKDV